MIDHGTGEIDLKKVASNFTFFIFKNIQRIKIILLAWLVCSILFFFKDRNNMKITYYLSTEYMSGQKIELILTDLKNLINQGKYAQLAEMINIPVHDAKKITSLKIVVEDPEYLVSAGGDLGPNYYFNETNTQITIDLKDSINVRNLVDQINQFVINSNYFNKVKDNEKSMVGLMNSSLEAQKNELDSMNKINLNKFINSSSNIIYANDISEIKRNVYGIEEKLIKNNRGVIRLNDPINLLNYPILAKKSGVESVLLALLKSLVIVLLLYFLYFFISGTRSAFAKYKVNALP
jgi:hypothetical protein